MNIYLVGGALRDLILKGYYPLDMDYVVTNSSRKQMLELGYKQLNKDFPVFFDQDNNDYALARKDISTGNSHVDYQFITDNISLEQDLIRRDFTVNAIACRKEDQAHIQKLCNNKSLEQRIQIVKDLKYQGIIIDPFNGVEDLAENMLRTHNPNFKQDPLRLLRAYRFSACNNLKIDNNLLTILDLIKPNIIHLQAIHFNSEYQKVVGCNSLLQYLKLLNENQILNHYGKFIELVFNQYGYQFWQQLKKIPGFKLDLIVNYLANKLAFSLSQISITPIKQHKLPLKALTGLDDLIAGLTVVDKTREGWAQVIITLSNHGYFNNNQLSLYSDLILKIYQAFSIYRIEKKSLEKYQYRFNSIEKWLSAIFSNKIDKSLHLQISDLPKDKIKNQIIQSRINSLVPQWIEIYNNLNQK